MCEPVSVISAVVSIASGVASYVGQRNAVNDAQEAETAAANAAAAADYQQQTLQQEQINASAAQDMTERLRQALKGRACIVSGSFKGCGSHGG